MKKIAIASGKGGVGKTSIAIALAKKLAVRYHVALVDLDIQMLNIRNELRGEIGWRKNKLIPIRDKNLEYVFYDASEKSHITWEHGDYSDIGEQLIQRVEWNNPDFMILDLPPGIDEVSRKILPSCDSVILVTQPHLFSISNVNRVIEFCRDEGIPVSGVILNYSRFVCPSCKKEFKIGQHELDFNSEIPIISEIPFLLNAKIDDIARYIDLTAVINAINNPIKLKKKQKIRAKMLKAMLKRGMI